MVDFNKLRKSDIEPVVVNTPKEVEDVRKELTSEQLVAFNKMVAFLRGNDFMFFLGGYAGTGKTHTIVRLIKYLLSDKGGDYKIGMSAPTNKAVRVLRMFMSMMDRRIDFATIHSMLGLREDISNGEITFKRDWKAKTTIHEYSVLIIDESSMLNDDLFEYLQEHKFRRSLKIIFMGDPAQIPPVNKHDSIPMREEGRETYGIDSVMLRNIVRQKEGNPLIELTMDIRENLNDENSMRRPAIKKVDGHGVEFIESNEQDRITEIFDKYFICEEFKKDADHAKIIAWTNKAVDRYNDKIRGMIYGEGCKKVELGEKLIANTPIFDNEETIIFQTSDEFEIVETAVKTDNIMGQEINYYGTTVEYMNYFTGQRMKKFINILHEDSELVFKQLLNKLSRMAKGFTPGTEMAKKGWVAFFKLKRVFADVKYAYAVTAHKSQGSTYKNVILIESDINFNKRVIERNRIKYTAASRPSENLYIIN